MSVLSVRASASFQGQGRRPAQEDCVLADPAKGIFILADGFGGGPGALASKTACEAVKHFLFKEAGDREATLPFVLRSYFSLAGNVLFNSLVFANRALQKLNQGKTANEKGGSSLIAGFLDGELLALANVGACSATLSREGRTTELVLPRTYSRLLDPFSGRPSGPGVADAPLMALGMAEDLEPEICEYRIRAGDWLLLHSDGVESEFFPQLALIQQKQQPPQESLTEIQQLFEAQPISDNASIFIAIF